LKESTLLHIFPHVGKGADMRGRHERLIHLYEGLAALAVFDRLDNYSAEQDPGDNDTRRSRQRRRAEILSEIGVLKAKKPWFEESYAQAIALLLLLIIASPAVR
jgi:hypothetical protein